MIGTQIDNYRILEKIGDGGMGSVYKAVDVMLEREVALKFLRPELASQPDLVERFRSEAIVLAKLHHPNIASLYGLHKHGDDFFMAMEYVRGETLDAMIRTAKQLPIEQASEVAASVLGALDYAHKQGIVHRDIKSANIILGPNGTKVMDFGIARVLGTDRRTRVGFVVGTIGYMAPEQIQGLDVDGRADIYALGVVLYEMITGRVPFEGESEWAVMQAQVQQMPVPPRVFASHIPVSLENTVMRALAKQAADRFQTAHEFQKAIQGALRQSGFHQTTSFIAVPQEDQMIAAPSDETREHKSNPHLASGEVAIGSGAFAVPPPVPRVPTAPPQPPPSAPAASAATPAAPVAVPPAAPAVAAPVAAMPAAAPAAARKPVANAAPVKGSAQSKGVGMAAIAVGLVVVLLGGAAAVGYRMWKARTANTAVEETTASTETTPTTDVPGTPAPAPPAAVAPPTPAAPTAVTPGGPPTATTTKPTVPGVPGAPGAKPTAPAKPTGKTTLTATPLIVDTPAPAVAEPTPAKPEQPAAVFGGVRVVTRPGRRAQETSAVLELRGSELRVRPLGSPERVVAYSSIHGAWFGTLRIDRLVGDDTRHLLFLDVGGTPLVLRLDKANYRTILPAFESRSGVSVNNRGDVTLADVER